MHGNLSPDDGVGGDEAERRLLLELVTDPPPEGDRLSDLADALGLSHLAVAGAALALTSAGLASTRADLVSATRAARRFDELWPAGR